MRRHCEHLVITGGEPLEHPDFAAVMRGLKTLKFRSVILTTNGNALDKCLPEVARCVTHLVISLQTLDPVRADAWYGAGDGVHGRILKNLQLAAGLPGRGYEIIISSVVTPANIPDLREVYRFADDHRFRLAVCPQLVGVKAHEGLSGNPGYRALYDFLISEKQKGARIQGTVDYLEYMRDLKKFDCRPFTMLVVSPTGDVFYPCLELGRHAGNLFEEPDLHRLRQAGLARFGPQPDCDTRCHSACALGFSRLLANPLSLASEAVCWTRSVLKSSARRKTA
jgi:MoaA/NifB/PqqE/SkfB family radical SAM enzyme